MCPTEANNILGFPELKHNVKNENWENVILVRESKKKVIFFVLQAKVKKLPFFSLSS